MEVLSVLNSDWRHDTDLHEVVTNQERMLNDHQQELGILHSNTIFDYLAKGIDSSERLMHFTQGFSLAAK